VRLTSALHRHKYVGNIDDAVRHPDAIDHEAGSGLVMSVGLNAYLMS